MLGKLKNSIEDAFLKYHVKTLVERYYILNGIDMKEIERITNRELVDLLTQILELQQVKFAEMERSNSKKDTTIVALRDKINKLEKTNEDLYERNESLVTVIKDAEKSRHILSLETRIGSKDNSHESRSPVREIS